MSDTVRIQIEADAAAVLRKLAPKTMLAVVKLAMDRALPIVHGLISKERLTGAGPFPVALRRLGVRTNRLRGSLRWTRATIDGDAVIATIGSNVKYAAAHEFGFDGTVQVKAHVRRYARAGGQVTTLRAAAKSKRKDITTGTGTVKAHARRMRIPERRPVRTGIEEHFSREMNEALRLELGNINAT